MLARSSVRRSALQRSTKASSGCVGSRVGAAAAPTARRSFSASSSAKAKSIILDCSKPTLQSHGRVDIRARSSTPTAGAAVAVTAWSTSAMDTSTIPGTSSPTEPSTSMGLPGTRQGPAGEVQGPAGTPPTCTSRKPGGRTTMPTGTLLKYLGQNQLS